MASTAELKLLADVQQAIKEFQQFRDSTAKSLVSIQNELKQTSTATAGVEAALKGLSTVAKVVGAAYAAIFAGGKVISFFQDATKSAIAQEEAVNNLNIALKQAGVFSEQTSSDLVAFADALQATTKFSDDAVLAAAGLIETYGRLGKEDLKAATNAAVELSAALGIDLNQAASLVGKAANGNVTALNKMGFAIEKGNSNAETFSNTLKALERLQGTAAAQTNTFAGALAQSGNAYDEVLESIGSLITQNPAVIEAVKLAAIGFNALADVITENKDVIGGFISDGIMAVLGVIPTLLQGLSLLNTDLLIVQEGFFALQKVMAYVSATFSVIADFAITALSPLSGVFETIFEALKQSIRDTLGALGIIGNAVLSLVGTVSDGASSVLKPAIDAVNKAAKDDLAAIGASEIAAEKAYQSRQKSIDALIGSVQTQIDQSGDVIRAKQAEAEATGKLTEDQIGLQNKLRQAIELTNAERIKAVQTAAKNPLGAFVSAGPGQEGVGLTGETGAAAGAGVVAASLKGAQGALDLLSGGVASVFDKLAPGFGAIAGEIFKALAQGPEKVREMINQFFTEIPKILRNVLDSIPVVLEEFAKNLAPLIVEVLLILEEKLPEIFDEILATFPQSLIDNFVPRLPEIISRLGGLMPQVAISFSQSLARQAVPISIAFANALIAQAPGIAQAIIDSVTSGATGGLIGGGGGGILGGVGGIFGFAEGGQIPNTAAFENDGAIIRASAGENIVDRTTNQRLENLLTAFEAGALGGSGGRGTYILEVDGAQFATVFRDVKARGHNLG